MSEIIRDKKIVRVNELPYPGRIYVKKGEKVEPSTLIAKTELLELQPGYFDVNSFFNTDLSIEEMRKVIKVNTGDHVVRGDVLATRGNVNFLVPYYGYIEHVSDSGGYILVRQKVSKDEEPLIVDLVAELGLGVNTVKHLLKVRVGDEILRGQALAGDIKIAYTPMTGTITDIIIDEGKVVIEPKYNPTILYANIYGDISEIEEYRSVSILTTVDLVKGAFGIGQDSTGILSPNKGNMTGKEIMFSTKKITKQEIEQAEHEGLSAIIAPSVDAEDLVDVYGEELYKGVTGVVPRSLSIILTEGFGDSEMDRELVNLLEANIGEKITLSPKTNLQTPIRRPEIYFYKSN